MGKPYSCDLRDRVQRHVEAGHTRRDAAIRFGVSASFAIKLDQRVRATGSSAPARQGRPAGSGPLAGVRDYLRTARGAPRHHPAGDGRGAGGDPSPPDTPALDLAAAECRRLL